MKERARPQDGCDLVRGCGARVVPVGRLDYNSEGLLLLTNDGDLLNALTHPRHEVKKHYEVRVRGNLETSRNSQSRWRLTATASVRQRSLPLTVTKSARSCA